MSEAGRHPSFKSLFKILSKPSQCTPGISSKYGFLVGAETQQVVIKTVSCGFPSNPPIAGLRAAVNSPPQLHKWRFGRYISRASRLAYCGYTRQEKSTEAAVFFGLFLLSDNPNTNFITAQKSEKRCTTS